MYRCGLVLGRTRKVWVARGTMKGAGPVGIRAGGPDCGRPFTLKRIRAAEKLESKYKQMQWYPGVRTNATKSRHLCARCVATLIKPRNAKRMTVVSGDK